jgi:hypothetical protein
MVSYKQTGPGGREEGLEREGFEGMLLAKRKLPLIRWLSLERQIIGTERRAQVWPTCPKFE